MHSILLFTTGSNLSVKPIRLRRTAYFVR
ncbi:DUF1010 domain-containing protein [Acidovorax sp. 39-64-12]